MSLQLRFGVAGAALGLLVGIIGGLVGGLPFPIVLLRTLIAVLALGVLGFILHAALKALLPELVQENESAAADDALESSGGSVNITIAEDDGIEFRPSADQAEPLRQAAASGRFADDSDESEDGGGMIEEVSEDRRARPITADAYEGGGFSEAAFYDGVEHLPDIGGFSEQFQAGDRDSPGVGEADAPPSGPREGGRSSGGAGQNNMDPALIAQAIRTSLKKG